MSSYDQNLLDEAPKATRAQLQEGYNVDLLEHPRRASSVRSPPPQTPQPTPAPVTVPLTEGNDSREKFPSTLPTPTPAPKPKPPFWRTRNGIVGLAILGLVVLGAVVGGAVGGTAGKSGRRIVVETSASSTAAVASTSTSTSTSDQGQGIAGQSTRSAGPSSTPAPTSTVSA